MSSCFSRADAQIASADYLSIKSPLTGVARERTVAVVTLDVGGGSKAVIAQTATLPRSKSPIAIKASVTYVGHALSEIKCGLIRFFRLDRNWKTMDTLLPLAEQVAVLLKQRRATMDYAVDKAEVLIVAVAHTHRRPDYWRDRLKGP